MVTLNVPSVVGVPVILPVLEAQDNPSGSPEAVYIIGAVSVAVRVTEYSSFV